jgi:hypothetical protein
MHTRKNRVAVRAQRHTQPCCRNLRNQILTSNWMLKSSLTVGNVCCILRTQLRKMSWNCKYIYKIIYSLFGHWNKQRRRSSMWCCVIWWGLSMGWRNEVTSYPSAKWSKKNYSCTSWCGKWWHCMPPIHQGPLTPQHSVIYQQTGILSKPLWGSDILQHKTGDIWGADSGPCDSVVGCVVWECWTLWWQYCWVCSLRLLDLENEFATALQNI